LAHQCNALPERQDTPLAAALRRLCRVLGARVEEDRTWDQIAAAMETRRKLTDAEGRMLDRLNQTFTVAQAVAFVRALGELGREFVPADQLPEFARRLRLVTLDASAAPQR
jgi:hypothetical protein